MPPTPPRPGGRAAHHRHRVPGPDELGDVHVGHCRAGDDHPVGRRPRMMRRYARTRPAPAARWTGWSSGLLVGDRGDPLEQVHQHRWERRAGCCAVTTTATAPTRCPAAPGRPSAARSEFLGRPPDRLLRGAATRGCPTGHRRRRRRHPGQPATSPSVRAAAERHPGLLVKSFRHRLAPAKTGSQIVSSTEEQSPPPSRGGRKIRGARAGPHPRIE